jgi:hypothetical protein
VLVDAVAVIGQPVPRERPVGLDEAHHAHRVAVERKRDAEVAVQEALGHRQRLALDEDDRAAAGGRGGDRGLEGGAEHGLPRREARIGALGVEGGVDLFAQRVDPGAEGRVALLVPALVEVIATAAGVQDGRQEVVLLQVVVEVVDDRLERGRQVGVAAGAQHGLQLADAPADERGEDHRLDVQAVGAVADVLEQPDHLDQVPAGDPVLVLEPAGEALRVGELEAVGLAARRPRPPSSRSAPPARGSAARASP